MKRKSTLEMQNIDISEELLEYLRDHQPHVYKVIDSSMDLRRQISKLDITTPGGLISYLKRAGKLLSSNASLERKKGTPKKAKLGMQVKANTPRFEESEEIGLQHIHKTAFIVVAGGLGK